MRRAFLDLVPPTLIPPTNSLPLFELNQCIRSKRAMHQAWSFSRAEIRLINQRSADIEVRRGEGTRATFTSDGVDREKPFAKSATQFSSVNFTSSICIPQCIIMT